MALWILGLLALVLPASTSEVAGETIPVQVYVPPGEGSCLDGSPQAYYVRKGSGRGNSSWIVFFPGGGWCANWTDCVSRSQTPMGSSAFLQPLLNNRTSAPVADPSLMPHGYGQGILSADPAVNPDFFDWNVAVLQYCDGGARLGQRGKVVEQGSELVFQGQESLQRVLQDLKETQGLGNASQVLLAGCSAGGHSLSVLCDWTRDRLPSDARVKCLLDGAFFLDSPDLWGTQHFRDTMEELHNSQWAALSAHPDCLADHRDEPWLCLLPEVSLSYTKTPTLLTNAIYDYAALGLFVTRSKDVDFPKTDAILKCVHHAIGCTAKARGAFIRYAQLMQDAASRVMLQAARSGGHGVEFVLLSSAAHCQVASPWWDAPQEGGVTLQKKVGDWFFRAQEGSPTQGEGNSTVRQEVRNRTDSTQAKAVAKGSQHRAQAPDSALGLLLLSFVLSASLGLM